MSQTFRVSGGDIYLTAGGKASMVEGSEKVNQDLADVQMTIYDEEANWGSEILALVGNVSQAIPGITGFIANTVADAVELLQEYQRFDEFVTADERITDIVHLIVLPQGSQQYQYYLVCQLEDDTEIPAGMNINLGQQFALTDILDVVIT